ncbi:hypothetical protein PGH12_00200 [Chryseobacterium wangxinyae]|uniref:hypothetical protein n=1 Tax=Chryseobacterium sp. CY350 TaxID=2997336 RepID=UPI0022721B79|nr:hypothetical protein [Chryseobacterium sp. CY350]MCY0977402.1 hypothetical protein [Chryseobacterium sp. CY350]WBZ95579.1 hypothetical protein PGH12_00200 [Chryseobacterium sp. CY350]
MREKTLREQSIDELYYNEHKTKNDFIKNSVLMIFIIAISIFVTAEKGFGIFTFLPLFCCYSILLCYVRLKNIREEIKSRLLHLKE